MKVIKTFYITEEENNVLKELAYVWGTPQSTIIGEAIKLIAKTPRKGKKDK